VAVAHPVGFVEHEFVERSTGRRHVVVAANLQIEANRFRGPSRNARALAFGSSPPDASRKAPD
jgi:hypothetical protein